MKKSNKITKIYVTVLSLIMAFAITTMVYAGTYPYSFSYISQYPNYVYFTGTAHKSDASSAIMEYESGPNATTMLYVEIWGATNWDQEYTNYTLSHLDGSSYVTYYKVKRGEKVLIKNLVYETFNETALTKLRLYTPATGSVSGSWSPTTY